MNKSLRQNALAIWNAGVSAVRGDHLIRSAVRCDPSTIAICERRLPLWEFDRILVVGAGKAAGWMAEGLEQSLYSLPSSVELSGWINVPQDGLRPTQRIHLHPARPPGVNEPTIAAIEGTEEILRRIAGSDSRTLVVVLLSGGGSALLVAPRAGIQLIDKQELARFVAEKGGDIRTLNLIRGALSRVKGGGLLRACRSGRLITLILSDVLGDPLEVIASGPTIAISPDPGAALAALRRLGSESAIEYGHPAAASLNRITTALQAQIAARGAGECRPQGSNDISMSLVADAWIVGNLERALRAAGRAAETLGYEVEILPVPQGEGMTSEVVLRYRQHLQEISGRGGRWCLLGGGEPSVRLVERFRRGRGGRNQQLIVEFAAAICSQPMLPREVGGAGDSWILLSAGTDGEDGPTDAAGGLVDEPLLHRSRELALDPARYAERNDAYPYLDRVSGLIRTGATGTNVCDLRVLLWDPKP